MARWVLHVDLDQFVVAVEVLRRPELRGRPVVVGGDGDPAKRGVVSSASYEARRYGVRSGVPLRTAARRCPEAVFLPVDKDAYLAASAAVMTTLHDLADAVEVLGWDEAFLATDADDPKALARRIQRRVREATHLDCTVGIGQNKLQAKLATGFGKPAGIFCLTDRTWFEVLGDLSTDTLWGIGSKTAKRLAALGIRTVAELAAADTSTLSVALGPSYGPWLVRLARGRDSSPVSGVPHVPRSRGHEITYQHDIEDWDRIRREVAGLAHRLAADLAREGRDADRVVVKVRFRPFSTSTHGRTLPKATAEPAALEQAALEALDRFTQRRPVRLLGVRAELSPLRAPTP